MHKDVYRHKQKLDELFSKVESVDDIEMKAEWAKYLCVRASGYIEKSVRLILSNFASDMSHDYVSGYVESQLKCFTSPKAGTIVDEVRCFSPKWAVQIEEEIDGAIKDALNSIVANRHQIAHGRDVDLSFVRMRNFYNDAAKVVDILTATCNSD